MWNSFGKAHRIPSSRHSPISCDQYIYQLHYIPLGCVHVVMIIDWAKTSHTSIDFTLSTSISLVARAWWSISERRIKIEPCLNLVEPAPICFQSAASKYLEVIVVVRFILFYN